MIWRRVRKYPGMRDVPLRQRAVFSALFFLQHWFPKSKRLQRRKGAVRLADAALGADELPSAAGLIRLAQPQ